MQIKVIATLYKYNFVPEPIELGQSSPQYTQDFLLACGAAVFLLQERYGAWSTMSLAEIFEGTQVDFLFRFIIMVFYN